MFLAFLMCWFKGDSSVSPCLEIVNNDPLKIVGTWNYEVTPSGNNTKLYGYANKEKTKLALLNDELVGYVEILPIPKGDSEYEMTGYRTAIIRNDSNLLSNRPPMRLQFFQVFPNIKKETYSFKFEVIGEENSDGFVILDNLKGLKSKPRAMGGKIYYLYKNNEWHLAEIEFTEKNK
jgi:hypothetical protein